MWLKTVVDPDLEPQGYGTGYFLWIQIQDSDSYGAKNTFMNNKQYYAVVAPQFKNVVLYIFYRSRF
jgi:hypothetical protein